MTDYQKKRQENDRKARQILNTAKSLEDLAELQSVIWNSYGGERNFLVGAFYKAYALDDTGKLARKLRATLRKNVASTRSKAAVSSAYTDVTNALELDRLDGKQAVQKWVAEKVKDGKSESAWSDLQGLIYFLYYRNNPTGRRLKGFGYNEEALPSWSTVAPRPDVSNPKWIVKYGADDDKGLRMYSAEYAGHIERFKSKDAAQAWADKRSNLISRVLMAKSPVTALKLLCKMSDELGAYDDLTQYAQKAVAERWNLPDTFSVPNQRYGDKTGTDLRELCEAKAGSRREKLTKTLSAGYKKTLEQRIATTKEDLEKAEQALAKYTRRRQRLLELAYSGGAKTKKRDVVESWDSRDGKGKPWDRIVEKPRTAFRLFREAKFKVRDSGRPSYGYKWEVTGDSRRFYANTQDAVAIEIALYYQLLSEKLAAQYLRRAKNAYSLRPPDFQSDIDRAKLKLKNLELCRAALKDRPRCASSGLTIFNPERARFAAGKSGILPPQTLKWPHRYVIKDDGVHRDLETVSSSSSTYQVFHEDVAKGHISELHVCARPFGLIQTKAALPQVELQAGPPHFMYDAWWCTNIVRGAFPKVKTGANTRALEDLANRFNIHCSVPPVQAKTYGKELDTSLIGGSYYFRGKRWPRVLNLNDDHKLARQYRGFAERFAKVIAWRTAPDGSRVEGDLGAQWYGCDSWKGDRKLHELWIEASKQGRNHFLNLRIGYLTAYGNSIELEIAAQDWLAPSDLTLLERVIKLNKKVERYYDFILRAFADGSLDPHSRGRSPREVAVDQIDKLTWDQAQNFSSDELVSPVDISEVARDLAFFAYYRRRELQRDARLKDASAAFFKAANSKEGKRLRTVDPEGQMTAKPKTKETALETKIKDALNKRWEDMSALSKRSFLVGARPTWGDSLRANSGYYFINFDLNDNIVDIEPVDPDQAGRGVNVIGMRRRLGKGMSQTLAVVVKGLSDKKQIGDCPPMGKEGFVACSTFYDKAGKVERVKVFRPRRGPYDVPQGFGHLAELAKHFHPDLIDEKPNNIFVLPASLNSEIVVVPAGKAVKPADVKLINLNPGQPNRMLSEKDRTAAAKFINEERGGGLTPKEKKAIAPGPGTVSFYFASQSGGRPSFAATLTNLARTGSGKPGLVLFQFNPFRQVGGENNLVEYISEGYGSQVTLLQPYLKDKGQPFKAEIAEMYTALSFAWDFKADKRGSVQVAPVGSGIIYGDWWQVMTPGMAKSIGTVKFTEAEVLAKMGTDRAFAVAVEKAAREMKETFSRLVALNEGEDKQPRPGFFRKYNKGVASWAKKTQKALAQWDRKDSRSATASRVSVTRAAAKTAARKPKATPARTTKAKKMAREKLPFTKREKQRLETAEEQADRALKDADPRASLSASVSDSGAVRVEIKASAPELVQVMGSSREVAIFDSIEDDAIPALRQVRDNAKIVARDMRRAAKKKAPKKAAKKKAPKKVAKKKAPAKKTATAKAKPSMAKMAARGVRTTPFTNLIPLARLHSAPSNKSRQKAVAQSLGMDKLEGVYWSFKGRDHVYLTELGEAVAERFKRTKAGAVAVGLNSRCAQEMYQIGSDFRRGGRNPSLGGSGVRNKLIGCGLLESGSRDKPNKLTPLGRAVANGMARGMTKDEAKAFRQYLKDAGRFVVMLTDGKGPKRVGAYGTFRKAAKKATRTVADRVQAGTRVSYPPGWEGASATRYAEVKRSGEGPAIAKVVARKVSKVDPLEKDGTSKMVKGKGARVRIEVGTDDVLRAGSRAAGRRRTARRKEAQKKRPGVSKAAIRKAIGEIVG